MSRQTLELAEFLDDAEIDAPNASHVEMQTFVIDRVAYTTIFEHPPSRLTWRDLRLGSSPVLRFFTLIKQAVWDKVESDIVFSVRISRPNEWELIFERDLNPRTRPSDRRPVEQSIDLEPWSGQTVDIELATMSTHGGGVAYGWSGWGNLRIEHELPEPAAHRRSPPRQGSRPPNLILITSDALRRDHLGCYGAEGVNTPNLDRLAREGLLFEHARAQTDTTFGSHCSLLTGMHPLSTGINVEWGSFPAGPSTLPRWLRDQGYTTIMAASERELGSSAACLEDAFQQVVPILGNPFQASAITVRRLLRRLAKKPDAPVFIWLQLFDPHPPMLPAGEAARRKYDADPTCPDRADRTHLFPKIFAAEARKEFEECGWDPRSGRLPSLVLERLRATLVALADRTKAGPDLTSQLEQLGESAWGRRSRDEFLEWFGGQLDDAERGQASAELYAWLDDLKAQLIVIERDLLGWIEGVVDFRYPEALYSASVECVDTAIGELREGLEALDVFEDSLIVFTAPHGECLGEEPAIFHHHVPAETVLRVPLIVRFPGGEEPASGGSVPHMFELVDLYPTMAEWLGLSPPEGLDGRSRARDTASRATVPCEDSVAVGMFGAFASLYRRPYKLVKSLLPDHTWPWVAGPRPADGAYLFHEDDETTDLTEAMPALKAELLDALHARLSNDDPNPPFDLPIGMRAG